MAIDRQHNMVIFICDGCEDDLDAQEREFGDAVAQMKRDGWASRKDAIGNGWSHYCDKCKDKY